MYKEDQITFRCIRCGNCCTDPYTIVNLSYSDVLRIKIGLDLDLNELLEVIAFYITSDYLDEKTKMKLVSPPIKTERGYSYIGLFKDEKGNCIFYDISNKKCKIYPLRPYFCRTFPFTFQSREKSEELDIFVTEKGKEYCLGLIEEAPHINKSDWLKLGKKVLKDLELNFKFVRQWNLLVKNNEVKASAKDFLHLILDLDKIKKN